MSDLQTNMQTSYLITQEADAKFRPLKEDSESGMYFDS
jgi:hypothetical protein